MASVKIILRIKNKKEEVDNKNTLYPLVIRITKDRKSSFIYTSYKVKEDDWDAENQRVKKSHQNSARLNNYLIKKIGEATNAALDLETNKTEVSSFAVKQRIKPKGGGTFFAQADLYLENLKKAKKRNQYSADKSRVKQFREFLQDQDISFADINSTLLKRFKAYLKRKDKDTTRSERTIVNHLVVIRTVFNLAIAAGVADRKHYPFGKSKIVIKFPDSLKIGLSLEEVKAIEDLELPYGSFLNHARNVWLFSFYFAGMRVSDIPLLKWTDFQNDRLFYAMGKNDKGGSLKVPEKALAILLQYKRDNPIHDLVFPELETLPDLSDAFKVDGRISQKCKRLNEGLVDIAKECKINKKLTMHIARHTFGNISGDRIPIQMLQKLYRHTSITTAIGYQGNFIHKDADQALDSVIGF